MNMLQSFLIHDSQNRDDGPEGTLMDLAEWLSDMMEFSPVGGCTTQETLVYDLRKYFDAKWVETVELPADPLA
jgi:hypothetical protein